MTLFFERSFSQLLKTASILVASTALFVGQSNAASYSVEHTKGSELTEWDTDNTPFTLAKFDTSLGTLQSVQITISSSALTSIFVTNSAVSSSSGNVRTSLTLSLTSSNVTLSGGIGNNVTLEFLVPGDRQYYSLGAGQSTEFLNLSNSGTVSFLYNSGLALTEFSGPGDILFDLTTLTETSQSNTGGNTGSSQQTTANGTVKVTYTYEAVPEPGTWAALAMGAGLLVASSRFRRRSA